jgi:hypothetical protein
MVAEVNTYTAEVTRAGKAWHVLVVEIDRVTQARHVNEIETMARDLISIMEDVPADSFDLEVKLSLPGLVQAHLDRADALRKEELRLRAEAAAESRAAAKELYDAGIPLRELGSLLGISHQRAQQLVNS